MFPSENPSFIFYHSFLIAYFRRRLTEMLLQQYPVLREDDAMRRAYIFVIDFLEAVGKETSSRMRQNQDSLRIILEVGIV